MAEVRPEDKTECALGGNQCLPDKLINDMFIAIGEEPTGDVQDLLKATNCNAESCLVNKIFRNHSERGQILNTYFKPKGPRDTIELLSNIHIDTVLERWATEYAKNGKRFHHLNYKMIDFMEQFADELNDYNFEKNRVKYDCMGLVMNSDVTSGPGKHWFAIFCDFTNIDKIVIEYFNSSGNPPYVEVAAWSIRVKGAFPKGVVEFKIVSDLVHQQGNTECGVYSLYYIYSRLKGIPSSAFNKNIITDDEMTEFRKVLFRSN
jgi:hypothetical protein